MISQGIEVFNDKPALEGLARTLPPKRYSKVHEDCVLHMITPWKPEGDHSRRPLIAFVQGSGWTHPDAYFEIPQLSMYAKKGYVVASIVHRNARDGFPFPAYLQDVKTAIRHLRANAEEYGIDPRRVCVWGTSSGGNTALLVGATAGDARYETDEYAGVDDGAQLVIDCFGPSDFPSFAKQVNFHRNELFSALAGERDPEEVTREMSPLLHLREGETYPPMLLIHGDADDVVPFAQSEMMYERLRALHQDATLIRVTGGVHEGNTWSPKLHERILRYLAEKL